MAKRTKPKQAPPAPARGHPSEYRAEFAERAKVLCENGAINADLAQEFDVCDRTILYWKVKHSEFREACRVGKEIADDRVQDSLYERAVVGDVTACIYWLKNRRPKEWRDRSQHEHSGPDGGPIKTEGRLTDIEVARMIAEVLMQAEEASESDADDQPRQTASETRESLGE